MLDADFWSEQAEKFLARAETIETPDLRAEHLDLAGVCKAVAAKIEERAPSG